MEIVALVVGGVLSVGAGYIANSLFARRRRLSLRQKQEDFLAKLHASLNAYADQVPSDEAEVVTRRAIVKQRVRELSNEIFHADVPPFESFRLEGAEYPDIACRWCHQAHTPSHGPRGDCRHCHLPLDLWISCQVSDCSGRGSVPTTTTGAVGAAPGQLSG